MDGAQSDTMSMAEQAPGAPAPATAEEAAARPVQPSTAARHAGRSWIPSIFVVFAMLMLLAVPVWLERRVSAVRANELQPAQEARGIINDVRQAFSEAEASFRGYLLTRDDRLRQAMIAAHTAEAAAFEELQSHAPALGPVLVDQIRSLRLRSEEAQRRRLGKLDGSATDAALAIAAHEQLLAESESVRSAVIQQVTGSRARMRTLERAGVLIMLGLGALALAATLVVIIVAHRDRRAAALEAELRAAALALAEAMEVEDILSRIAARAARTVAGASSFVERIDEENGDVVVVTTAGSHVLPAGTRLPFPGSLTEAALRNGAPEQFRVSAMAERPSTSLLRTSCADCAGAVVPLISEKQAQGALVLLRRGPRGFRPREIMQLRVLGVFAALALRKAVLLERAVEQQRELQAAVHTRETMVRGFSHDLKNPLGAADGHAALLEEGVAGELAAPQQEHVGRIRASLHSALEIIDDVVELARADAGELPVESTRVDAARLVTELASEYGATAAAAGLEFETQVPEQLPAIMTDPRRVRQVLGNLLSNAIKYTPTGGRVRLRAEVRRGRRSRDPTQWFTFSVDDTGRGIAPEDVPALFQEFHRVDPGAVPGAGLGLAISERIARLLGGEIRVHSEVGKGSTFTLWLPCRGERTRTA